METGADVFVRADFAGGPVEYTSSAFLLSGGAGSGGAIWRVLLGVTPLGVGFAAEDCVSSGAGALAFPIEERIELRNCSILSDWLDSFYHIAGPTLIAPDD